MGERNHYRSGADGYLRDQRALSRSSSFTVNDEVGGGHREGNGDGTRKMIGITETLGNATRFGIR